MGDEGMSTSSLRDTIASFNKKSDETNKKLSKNPFAENYSQPQHSKTDERYGRPEVGSKTEKRGIKAGEYVCREVMFLCEMIDRFAQPALVQHSERGQIVVKQIRFGPLFEIYASYSDKWGVKLVSLAGDYVCQQVITCCEFIDMRGELSADGTTRVTFGSLWAVYSRYSENVVGMLIRARKYGLVDFEGEMLYQRQDDQKIVTLLYPLDEIRRRLKTTGDPKDCIKFV